MEAEPALAALDVERPDPAVFASTDSWGTLAWSDREWLVRRRMRERGVEDFDACWKEALAWESEALRAAALDELVAVNAEAHPERVGRILQSLSGRLMFLERLLGTYVQGLEGGSALDKWRRATTELLPLVTDGSNHRERYAQTLSFTVATLLAEEEGLGALTLTTGEAALDERVKAAAIREGVRREAAATIEAVEGLTGLPAEELARLRAVLVESLVISAPERVLEYVAAHHQELPEHTLTNALWRMGGFEAATLLQEHPDLVKSLGLTQDLLINCLENHPEVAREVLQSATEAERREWLAGRMNVGMTNFGPEHVDLLTAPEIAHTASPDFLTNAWSALARALPSEALVAALASLEDGAARAQAATGAALALVDPTQTPKTAAPDLAVRLLQEHVPPGPSLDQAVQRVALLYGGRDEPAALSWTQHLPEEQAAASRLMILQNSQQEPADAAAWLAPLLTAEEGAAPAVWSDGARDLAESAVRQVATLYAQEAPREGMAWVEALPLEEARPLAAKQVAGEWAAYDQEGFSGWLADQPASPLRDVSVEALVASLLTDHGAAWAWAASAGDSALRGRLLTQVQERWKKDDATAAQAAAARLAPEDAARLVSPVP